MAEMDTTSLIAALAVAIALGAVIYAIIDPFISGSRAVEKRMSAIADAESRNAKRVASEQNSTRRKAVADSLKDLESRHNENAKVDMRLRLQRAGMLVPMKSFYMSSALAGLGAAILALISFPSMPVVAVVIGFVGAIGLPRWYIARATKRRQAKFLKDFANAVDVIVRGIKSGLPLNECLAIIARESPDPISTEFADVVEQQRVGVPISEALERMMQRVPLPEVKFFAVVIAIQQKSGGNLSEALGNLAGVLRDRIRLQMKVKAMSAEAKASAGVLASLPPIVGILVYLTSPQYIEKLWTTSSGRFLLLICLFWMTCGVLVMRKMINFKF